MHAKTLTIVLAGGAGRRLHPLTANRAKPAVPFGGKYRIIDFTLSNCLHSGLRRILVLTQYKSHSLMSTHALASMGIYVFPLAGLCAILREDHDLAGSSHDFGKDILPRLIRTHEVYAYQFGGIQGRVTQDRYWRDVGTLDTYYEANMDLLLPHPPIDLYQEDCGPYGATSDLTRLPARCPAGPGGRRNWPTRSRLRERSLPAPRYVTRFSSPMCV